MIARAAVLASSVVAAAALLPQTPAAVGASTAAPGVTVAVDRNWPSATREFKFAHVPPPSSTDAATNAQRLLIDGEVDDNGATLAALTDGLVPHEEDEPGSNLFFNAGTGGGSFRLDLGRAVPVAQVHSYSWHPNTRGPQVYALYVSEGTAAGFDPAPKGAVDPAKAGWTWIANVDTRPAGGEMGGQYGVNIAMPAGMPPVRYLLFVCSATETNDEWGNTFYSEIDVIARASSHF